jgi:hypothetical protein
MSRQEMRLSETERKTGKKTTRESGKKIRDCNETEKDIKRGRGE